MIIIYSQISFQYTTVEISPLGKIQKNILQKMI